METIKGSLLDLKKFINSKNKKITGSKKFRRVFRGIEPLNPLTLNKISELENKTGEVLYVVNNLAIVGLYEYYKNLKENLKKDFNLIDFNDFKIYICDNPELISDGIREKYIFINIPEYLFNK